MGENIWLNQLLHIGYIAMKCSTNLSEHELLPTQKSALFAQNRPSEHKTLLNVSQLESVTVTAFRNQLRPFIEGSRRVCLQDGELFFEAQIAPSRAAVVWSSMADNRPRDIRRSAIFFLF